MKNLPMKSISTIIALFICVAVSAQLQNPVSWIFSAKKLGNKMYEVHLTASISGKYHMYAQKAKGDPEDLVPTSISFIRNPLLTLQGPVKELGKKITKYEKVWEASW
jgi:thiol:disulfide interchange protein DsbD